MRMLHLLLRPFCPTLLLSTAVLLVGVPSLLSRAGIGTQSNVPDPMLKTECTFADGSSIAIGRHASGSHGGEADTWRAGDYQATRFRVSGRMIIPPMSSPIEIPNGLYTLFVMTKSEPPWTLIVSKKTAEWGILYPGKQYDLARISLGSDVAQSSETFVIGCMQQKNAPTVVWMQSGKYVGYAKIMAERIKDGRAEYLWH